MYVCMYVYVQVCEWVYVCMHVCMYFYLCHVSIYLCERRLRLHLLFTAIIMVLYILTYWHAGIAFAYDPDNYWVELIQRNGVKLHDVSAPAGRS